MKGGELNGLDLDELTFLLESGSDRIGALDFQASATHYIGRGTGQATLDQLLTAAERVEKNLPLSPELDQALHHGSSIGGARPKALIEDGARKFIAKFSSSSDAYSVVKGEYIAMRLAALSGLNVAPVEIVRASGKDVLLVQRFDRFHAGDAWYRRSLGPVCTAATVHFCAAVPNFSWLEIRNSPAETHLGFENSDFFPVQPKLEGAFYPVSDAPGLGIEVNEELLARQSFEFWEAPHLKRRDGSVTNW
ncbi:HipA domain-containing protein [Neorhizobium sp. BT27B]|uniref:HipA domain-containing protein n=1 Tax=Neorhizobium sp. BT27B TaxID=3142625 RepID=UPI003D27B41E